MIIGRGARHLLIQRIDYSAPVLQIQRRLTELRAWLVRSAPSVRCVGCFIWIPFVLWAVRGRCSAPTSMRTHRKSSTGFIASSGVAVSGHAAGPALGARIRAARRFAAKLERQRGRPQHRQGAAVSRRSRARSRAKASFASRSAAVPDRTAVPPAGFRLAQQIASCRACSSSRAARPRTQVDEAELVPPRLLRQRPDRLLPFLPGLRALGLRFEIVVGREHLTQRRAAFDVISAMCARISAGSPSSH